MNYSDFRLDNDGDIIFTADGDIEIIKDPDLILQDTRGELGIPIESIEWDPEAGSEIPFFLSAVDISDNTIISELERVALHDPRIAADSVKAEKIDINKFRLQFRPLAFTSEQSIVYMRSE